MNVESRDSVSLKPAELDEFAQLLSGNGLSLTDEQLDLQVEAFPLAVVAMLESEVQGVMLGSLERIGGTPAILWGLGVARKGKHGRRRAEGDDRRAVPPRRDLVPRRGRARRDAPVAAELLHAALELREPRAPAGLRPERRRPRVGPSPRQALRPRAALRRPRASRSP